jgi:hypothetical protein
MYYADKEDAYIMKYFFDQDEINKNSDKILKLTDEIKWEDICNVLEDVDINGEEKLDLPSSLTQDQPMQSTTSSAPQDDKDKKKKKKKKNK